MIEPDLPHRAALAEAVARDAASLALDMFHGRGGLKVEVKAAQDYVSEADRAVERRVRDRLAALFPGEPILGEEGGADPGDLDAGAWVIDPIDGTWCFLNGIQSFCVSLAYVADGAILVGVIVDPCAGETFVAYQGGGATLNGAPIRVADVDRLDAGSIAIGASRRTQACEVVPVIGALMDEGGLYHRHGSGALGLAWTACGRLIGYVEAHMNSWDCLAGLVLVREAGGRTNDFLAGNGLRDGNPVLAGPLGVWPHLVRLTEPWGERHLPG